MEQKKLAGVAVDAIFDSVSVATSYKQKLLEVGVVFCSFSEAVEKYPVEGDLVRRVRGNITRLQQTGSYRGSRHSKNLPSRGQRTRHNARGKRGKRKTIGAFKKDMLNKTQQDQKK